MEDDAGLLLYRKPCRTLRVMTDGVETGSDAKKKSRMGNKRLEVTMRGCTMAAGARGDREWHSVAS